MPNEKEDDNSDKLNANIDEDLVDGNDIRFENR